MTKETYRAMTEGVRSRRWLCAVLPAANLLLASVVVCLYGGTLLLLVLSGDLRIVTATLVPGIAFVLLSIVRKKIDAKRPYEVFDLPPAMPKDKNGQSFPSRHIFSAFVIGTVLLFLYPVCGVICLAAGVCLAVIRVVTGVHFPRDVAAGALIGILSGLIAGVWL